MISFTEGQVLERSKLESTCNDSKYKLILQILCFYVLNFVHDSVKILTLSNPIASIAREQAFRIVEISHEPKRTEDDD